MPVYSDRVKLSNETLHIHFETKYDSPFQSKYYIDVTQKIRDQTKKKRKKKIIKCNLRSFSIRSVQTVRKKSNIHTIDHWCELKGQWDWSYYFFFLLYNSISDAMAASTATRIYIFLPLFWHVQKWRKKKDDREC